MAFIGGTVLNECFLAGGPIVGSPAGSISRVNCAKPCTCHGFIAHAIIPAVSLMFSSSPEDEEELVEGTKGSSSGAGGVVEDVLI